MFAAVSVPDATRNYIGRGVRVNTTRDYLFTHAMVAKGQIDMKGNNVTTDSFNSSDPNYSTNTQYTSTKRKAKGDVATETNQSDRINGIGRTCSAAARNSVARSSKRLLPG